MKAETWNQIERDFVEWDNASHSNASQRQILDWFKERLSPSLPGKTAEEILKKHIEGIFLFPVDTPDKLIEETRDKIIEAMEEYASQFARSNVRGELNNFRDWFNRNSAGCINDQRVDEYLEYLNSDQ